MAKRQLGKYELIERLGRGGMAEVFRAYQASLDRHVAIKLLHPFLADDPEFKERFEREARNVARLRHSNIVQVYDFDYDADSESYFMVMELIEGQTLKDYMAQPGKSPMQISEALPIVRQALEALVYAHTRSMIHRDLKPANLMIEQGGRVVLTDFGIAKIVTGTQFTASGGMVGTPAYMAPEQGLGEIGDERSDLYSVGVILYHLVTGRLPFEAETPVATILKHVNEPIPPIREINRDVPPDVEKLILTAMAKEAEERYRSAEVMLGEVNRLLTTASQESSVVTTAPPAPTPPVGVVKPKNEDTVQLDTSATKLTQPLKAERSGRIFWGLALLALGVMIGVLVLGAINTGVIPVLNIVLRASETPTSTASPTATSSPTVTASPTVTTTASPTQTATSTMTLTQTPTITPTATNTATSTSTATYTATQTPSPTPTSTPTFTLTATSTPSNTSTPSRTPSPTSTQTSTNTPTPTITPTFTNTPTPTFNLTATLDAATIAAQAATATVLQRTVEALFQTANAAVTRTPDYTATARRCRQSFDLISPLPDDARALKDPIKAGTFFERAIVLRNTGDCDWLPGMYLSFKGGDQIGAPLRVDMDPAITTPMKPGETARFIFRGRAPDRGRLYTGSWELRTKDGVLINPLVEIAFFIFQQP